MDDASISSITIDGGVIEEIDGESVEVRAVGSVSLSAWQYRGSIRRAHTLVTDSIAATIQDTSFTLLGSWARQDDESTTDTAGDWGFYQFMTVAGASLEVYCRTAPTRGLLGFSIDYGPQQYIDLYSDAVHDSVLVLTLEGLSATRHTIKISCIGSASANSQGIYVGLDKIVIDGAVTGTIDSPGAIIPDNTFGAATPAVQSTTS